MCKATQKHDRDMRRVEKREEKGRVIQRYNDKNDDNIVFEWVDKLDNQKSNFNEKKFVFLLEKRDKQEGTRGHVH